MKGISKYSKTGSANKQNYCMKEMNKAFEILCGMVECTHSAGTRKKKLSTVHTDETNKVYERASLQNCSFGVYVFCVH